MIIVLSTLACLSTNSIVRADGTNIPMLPSRVLRLLQIFLLVGIILGIVGGSKLANDEDVSEAETLLKVSVIFFTVALAAVVLGLITTTLNLRHVPSGERRLVLACWLSLPFVVVRLVYSLASVFAEDNTFNYFYPNFWIRTFMAIVMEFIVTIIVIFVGLLTEAISKGAGSSSTATNPTNPSTKFTAPPSDQYQGS